MRTAIFFCVLIAVNDACVAQSPFRLDTKREWIILGCGAALNIAAVVATNQLSPLTAEEIGELDPGDINDFDRRAINPYRETHAGDGLLIASFLLPLTTLAYHDTRKDWKIIGVMWAQTMMIQAGAAGLVKGIVHRTRPYVYDPNTPMEKKTAVDARLSFYSGHTTTSAANSFFVARVFNDYVAGKRVKVLIWTGAALYPVFTGYLRRDSGHHFRTDVIAGYFIGAAIGYLVPELHRIRDNSAVSIEPTAAGGNSGVSLVVAF